MGRSVDLYRDYSLPEVIFRRSYSDCLKFSNLQLDTPDGVFYGRSEGYCLESGVHPLILKWNVVLGQQGKEIINLEGLSEYCTEYEVWSRISDNGYYFYCELLPELK